MEKLQRCGNYGHRPLCVDPLTPLKIHGLDIHLWTAGFVKWGLVSTSECNCAFFKGRSCLRERLVGRPR